MAAMAYVHLLDHLIRPKEQRWRDREAKRLSRLSVDHQLDLRRLLHGEIRRFRSFENAVDVLGSALTALEDVGSVEQEDTGLGSVGLAGEAR